MMKKRNKYKYQRVDDDGSAEETELVVTSRTPRRETPCVERKVENGDTLQSLAIRNFCTIEDIKRLNNIHKENEIYARNTIKVPVKPFSEALAPVHTSGSTTPENGLIDVEPPTVNVVDLNSKLDAKAATNQTEVNEIIFNTPILQKPTDANVNAVDVLKDEEELPNTSSDIVGTLLNCNGVDGDISYVGLVVFIVLMVVAGPLIYAYLYLESNHHHHHHQT